MKIASERLSYLSLFGIIQYCLMPAFPVKGQDRKVVPLPKLTDTIIFDGVGDEIAWEKINPLPMTVYRPVYKGEVSEPTDIRVAYNENYLYLSARMVESNPENIRTNTLFRDQYSGDDLLAVILDTYNDNENALFFHINPAGTRVDIALSNDAEGDFLQVTNFDWNTHWDAKTVQDEHGWSAEIRIPFTSLRFQAEDGRVIMGIIIYRYRAINNEVQVYPDISPQFNFYKPSKAQRILLNDIEDRNPVYFTPYLFGGLEQIPMLSSGACEMQDNFIGDLGLDLKYNLTNSLTLDATINTDFAQVEADEQQINLTRFSLFFSEKRQFFQERASIFDYKLGFQERLFHSRRIGLSDNGNPIPILGGLRLVGQKNGWDIGFLNMQTARFENIPSENFGVARLRRQVFNPYSYVGGLVTSRYNEEGNFNLAYGLDGIFRIAGNEYFSLQWSQTIDSDIEQANFLETGLGRLRWERRQLQGLHYFTDITWSGPEYRPEMGFFVRRDVIKFVGNFGYGWLRDEKDAIRMVTASLPWLVSIRNDDGSVESGFARHRWLWEWKSGSSLTVGLEMNYEDLRSPLSFPEKTIVPTGNYEFYLADVFYSMGLAHLFRINLGIGAGTFYDGEKMDLNFEPIWNLSRHLEIGGAYQFNTVRFPERVQSFNAHIGRFRIQSAFNSKASLYTFIQYNSDVELLSANIRFRYNFREGNDLWVVYNEGFNTYRRQSVPVLPVSGGRSFQVKYTYTFIW